MQVWPYVVRKRDTLLRIAKRFAVNEVALLCANPALRSDARLVPGEIVYIPREQLRQYVMQPADTIDRLAGKFNVSSRDIIAINPHLRAVNPQFRTHLLYPGQVIAIPLALATARIVHADQEYGYEEIRTDLRRLQRRYPFLFVKTIGHSEEGKPLLAIRLGDGSKELGLFAASSGDAWCTTLLLMRFVEDCCAAFHNGTRLVGYSMAELFRQTAIWLVPLVAPDDVERAIAGGDGAGENGRTLSEWPQFWTGSGQRGGYAQGGLSMDLAERMGTPDPAVTPNPAGLVAEVVASRATVAHLAEGGGQVGGREREGGREKDWDGQRRRHSSPVSQQASSCTPRAVTNFITRHNFRLVISFCRGSDHISWGYNGLEPREAEVIANRLAHVSGYTSARYTDGESALKDWFIRTFRRPAYTVEVSMPALAQFPALYERQLRLLLYAASVYV
ncbi:LysM peptidoglycan-binding domain-containing protein [Numidum massiliense]|uniref:LysM peptidoglycan-binding domain-containing protein n=1 Tax=Numidum massiliense TaxID=1522315 RepID=UPI0006D57523|nr:LysM peptidoglycan-binding domain-containing protein [Numidum massiliense]